MTTTNYSDSHTTSNYSDSHSTSPSQHIITKEIIIELLSRYITKYMINIYTDYAKYSISKFQKILINIAGWDQYMKNKEFRKFIKWSKLSYYEDEKIFYECLLYISRYLYDSPKKMEKSQNSLYNKVLYKTNLIVESKNDYEIDDILFYKFGEDTEDVKDNDVIKDIEIDNNIPCISYISLDEFHIENEIKEKKACEDQDENNIKNIILKNKTKSNKKKLPTTLIPTSDFFSDNS